MVGSRHRFDWWSGEGQNLPIISELVHLTESVIQIDQERNVKPALDLSLVSDGFEHPLEKCVRENMIEDVDLRDGVGSHPADPLGAVLSEWTIFVASREWGIYNPT